MIVGCKALTMSIMLVFRSLLNNPTIFAKIGQLHTIDARSTEAQRLNVRLRVDRGAGLGQPSELDYQLLNSIRMFNAHR